MEKVIAAWRRKTGLDVKALAKEDASRVRSVKALALEQKSRLSKVAGLARADVESHAKSVGASAATSGFFGVPSFTLDKPVRITSRPFGVLKSKTIKPFKSFAKFRIDRDEEGTDTVKFVYEWPNPFGDTVHIDAVTSIAASGLLELQIDGGLSYHWGTMDASVEIAVGVKRGNLRVHEQQFLRGAILAYNQPLVIGDGHESGGIHGEMQLTALGQPIEVRKTAQIEVRIKVISECGSGFRARADFESGLLGMSCPLVVIRVHGVPSVLMPGLAGMLNS